MWEKTSKCHNNITSLHICTTKMWPIKDNVAEQNYHYIQIPWNIEVNKGFAVNCHLVLFFNLDELVISWEETQGKITKKLERMKILLEEGISNLIVIMCTHARKQLSWHAKIHL